MNEQERVIELLADTLLKTRLELDAMRQVVIALAASTTRNTEHLAVFRAELMAAMERDTAVTLASPLTDESLTRRKEWIAKLVPSQCL